MDFYINSLFIEPSNISKNLELQTLCSVVREKQTTVSALQEQLVQERRYSNKRISAHSVTNLWFMEKNDYKPHS